MIEKLTMSAAVLILMWFADILDDRDEAAIIVWRMCPYLPTRWFRCRVAEWCINGVGDKRHRFKVTNVELVGKKE